jgi:hypothetical protein
MPRLAGWVATRFDRDLTSATRPPSVLALRFADFAVPPMFDFVRTRSQALRVVDAADAVFPEGQSVQEEEGAACVLFRGF